MVGMVYTAPSRGLPSAVTEYAQVVQAFADKARSGFTVALNRSGATLSSSLLQEVDLWLHSGNITVTNNDIMYEMALQSAVSAVARAVSRLVSYYVVLRTASPFTIWEAVKAVSFSGSGGLIKFLPGSNAAVGASYDLWNHQNAGVPPTIIGTLSSQDYIVVSRIVPPQPVIGGIRFGLYDDATNTSALIVSWSTGSTLQSN